jgi:hypothetical protein
VPMMAREGREDMGTTQWASATLQQIHRKSNAHSSDLESRQKSTFLHVGAAF